MYNKSFLSDENNDKFVRPIFGESSELTTINACALSCQTLSN